ncbi:hypothetical protein C5167_011930 [Papaver somniferum]|uniref:Uncharacterized protein n=1 Tax=Papaver somniferum TaxID=3469 RepID=A0A4Y7IZY5_PAPSO|nr:late embryogenesis abundant protein Lea5-like [Papaver somniferum]RZC53068.1 hypothetical protein C5167_011930 [Papaver somniferum]
MAGSLSNTKIVLTALIDGISLSINRSRGITTVASQAAGSSVVRQVKVKKPSTAGTEESSWVPDPVTGYYRPENHADDIDVAALRETLMNQKINHH